MPPPVRPHRQTQRRPARDRPVRARHHRSRRADVSERDNCAKTLGLLTTQKKAIADADAGLTDELALRKITTEDIATVYRAIYDRFDKLAKALNTRLTKLTSLNDPGADTLLETLSGELTTLRGALAQKKAASAVWTPLQPELAALLGDPPPADSVTASFSVFDTSVGSIESNQSKWREKIIKKLQDDEQEMSGKIKETEIDPIKASAEVSDLVGKAAHTLAQAAAITDTLADIERNIRPDFLKALTNSSKRSRSCKHRRRT